MYVCMYCAIIVLFCLPHRFNFNTTAFDTSDLTTFYLPDCEAFEVRE